MQSSLKTWMQSRKRRIGTEEERSSGFAKQKVGPEVLATSSKKAKSDYVLHPATSLSTAQPPNSKKSIFSVTQNMNNNSSNNRISQLLVNADKQRQQDKTTSNAIKEVSAKKETRETNPTSSPISVKKGLDNISPAPSSLSSQFRAVSSISSPSSSTASTLSSILSPSPSSSSSSEPPLPLHYQSLLSLFTALDIATSIRTNTNINHTFNQLKGQLELLTHHTVTSNMILQLVFVLPQAYKVSEVLRRDLNEKMVKDLLITRLTIGGDEILQIPKPATTKTPTTPTKASKKLLLSPTPVQSPTKPPAHQSPNRFIALSTSNFTDRRKMFEVRLREIMEEHMKKFLASQSDGSPQKTFNLEKLPSIPAFKLPGKDSPTSTPSLLAQFRNKQSTLPETHSISQRKRNRALFQDPQYTVVQSDLIPTPSSAVTVKAESEDVSLSSSVTSSPSSSTSLSVTSFGTPPPPSIPSSSSFAGDDFLQRFRRRNMITQLSRPDAPTREQSQRLSHLSKLPRLYSLLLFTYASSAKQLMTEQQLIQACGTGTEFTHEGDLRLELQLLLSLVPSAFSRKMIGISAASKTEMIGLTRMHNNDAIKEELNRIKKVEEEEFSRSRLEERKLKMKEYGLNESDLILHPSHRSINYSSPAKKNLSTIFSGMSPQEISPDQKIIRSPLLEAAIGRAQREQ